MLITYHTLYICIFLLQNDDFNEIIIKVIKGSILLLFFCITIWVFLELQTPIKCDSLVEQLQNGSIARTPLLQPGQTIADLPHGAHNVTGGIVNIGNLGNGTVSKVIGINPLGSNPHISYVPGTQPYNQNFGSILFELKQAGIKYVSHSSLDFFHGGREQATNTGNVNMHFLQSYRTFTGKPAAQYGDITITNKLINGIAE